MIAGEDTELSMRLRKRGWRLRSLDAEMTLHDAAITRFSQWWARIAAIGPCLMGKWPSCIRMHVIPIGPAP